jgi:hypothetical protein
MRITIEVPDRLATVFKGVAKDQEISQTDLVRRAMMTYAVLHKEVSNGASVILRNGKEEKELVFTFD